MSDIKAGDSDAGRAGAEARDDSSAEAPWDLLLTDARLATLAADAPGYGAVEPAAIAVRGERIAWLGPMTELPASETRRHPASVQAATFTRAPTHGGAAPGPRTEWPASCLSEIPGEALPPARLGPYTRPHNEHRQSHERHQGGR